MIGCHECGHRFEIPDAKCEDPELGYVCPDCNFWTWGYGRNAVERG
jgi:predicted RNA-binding Zn-ribbon protein involved in translation (DUF1610 family)